MTRQTIGKENDPTRYFTSQDLYELFKVGDFTKSKVCDEFNELHGTLEDKLLKELQATDRQDLTEEQQTVLRHKNHIINNLEDVINISEHSLVFSKKTETLNTSDIDFAYLNNEVKTAKELLFKENLLSAGSRNPDLENEYLSAKQRILTQKFGVEFLPLGKNFNQYREGKNKFEFRPAKPKSPVKIVVDDDDDIQFIDTSTNEIIPRSNTLHETKKIIPSSNTPHETDMYSKLISDDSDDSLLSNDSSVNSSNDKSLNTLSINTSIYSTAKNTPTINIARGAENRKLNNLESNAVYSTPNRTTIFNRSTNKSPQKLSDKIFASPAKSINDSNINDLSLNLSIMDIEEGPRDKNNLSVMSNDISELTSSFNSSIRLEERNSPRVYPRTSSKDDSESSSQSKDKTLDDSVIILD